MLDYFEDSDYYYIVMGLHGEGMDLFDYIELNDHIEEKEICRMFKQIALGVQHLHDNKIVHRDIKDENVVLDHEHGGLRLIDFGSAAYLKPGRKYETFVGTLDYAAPEILRGHTYSGKPQDVWALGILLFTLVYRENPFYDIDEIMGRELRIPFVLSEGNYNCVCYLNFLFIYFLLN
jgi:serine/threonine protein kinase